MNDEELLDLIGRNPEDGMRHVLVGHGPLLLGRLAKHARDKGYGDVDVEDVFQDVLVLLVQPEERHRIRAAGSAILPWLTRLGYWRLADRARRRRREGEIATHVAETVAAAPPARTSAAASAVQEVFGQLRPRDRDVLILKYDDTLSNADIGGRLGINEGAAKKAAHDARRRLRELLDARGVNSG